MTRTCPHCRREFTATSDYLGRKFCSRECMGLDRRRQVQRTCQLCGLEFTTRPSWPRQFCSVACRQEGHRSTKYKAVHERLRRERWAGVCEHCGGRARELALIQGRGRFRDESGRYAGRELSDSRDDYIELCASCHRFYDGRRHAESR